MPKRTNDFQQLVAMIQQAFAPTNAKVTESYMWDGWREIDALIETEAVTYQIKIAVEVKKEKRPFDVEEMEAIIGKYKSSGSIPVDKVVVVARKGFTRGARRRAAEVGGIVLRTLQEAQQSDWTMLAPQMMKLNMPPTILRVELQPPVASENGKDPVADGRFVCKCHGNDKGSPLQWAAWLLRFQILGNAPVLRQLEEAAKRQNRPITVSLPCPMTSYLLAFEGKRYPVENIVVHFRCASVTSPVTWSSFNLSGKDATDKTIDHLEAVMGGQRMRIVFPDGPTSEKVILKLDDAPANKQDDTPAIPDETFPIQTIKPDIEPHDMPPACPIAQHIPATNKTLSGLTKPEMKLGRNDPCPCNSGKKFKNCCLKKSR